MSEHYKLFVYGELRYITNLFCKNVEKMQQHYLSSVDVNCPRWVKLYI